MALESGHRSQGSLRYLTVCRISSQQIIIELKMSYVSRLKKKVTSEASEIRIYGVGTYASVSSEFPRWLQLHGRGWESIAPEQGRSLDSAALGLTGSRAHWNTEYWLHAQSFWLSVWVRSLRGCWEVPKWGWIYQPTSPMLPQRHCDQPKWQPAVSSTRRWVEKNYTI